jgi:hypothetical protein
MDETMVNFIKTKHPAKMLPLKPYSAKWKRDRTKSEDPRCFQSRLKY